MSYSLGSARGVIDLSYTGSTAVRRAQADVGGLQRTLSAAGISAGTLGKAAALGIGGAVVAGLAVAAKSAAAFEKRLSAIQAVSGATTSEMDSLRNKALQLGADTVFSASEAASAIEELIKAGISVADVMGGAADATVALAAAGEIDLAQAATIASNAMNQFNLNAAQLPGVVDAIAGAANASAIDVSDLGHSLTQVGAVANLAGMKFEDTATAIALMGNAGIKGSDAGTSLKTMLQNLQPTTEKQIGLFEDLGIVTEEGTNRFFDAQGNIKSYAKVAGVLSKALEGQTKAEKLRNLEVMFGTDAIRAAAIAADAGAEGVRKMNKEMSKTTAAEVAATRMDNLSGSFEQLTGSLDTALIIMGTPLLSGLRSIVDGLTAGVNGATEFGQGLANDLNPGINDLIDAGGNVITVLKNIWDMFSGLGGSLGDLALDIVIAAFTVLADVIEKVTGALEGQEELIFLVGAAWLILANGGIARVIAQLGWFAAYAVVRALDGLMALQAGATTATGSITALGGALGVIATTVGAVASIGAAVFAWMAYKKAVAEVKNAVDAAGDAIKGTSTAAINEQRKALEDLNKEYADLQLDPGLSDTEKAFTAVKQSASALLHLDFDKIGKMTNISNGLKETQDALDAIDARTTELTGSTLTLASALGDIDPKHMVELLNGVDNADPKALQELDAMLAGYDSQLKQVGLTQDDVINAWKGDNSHAEIAGISGALIALRTNYGRTAGASDGLSQAVEDFSNEALSAEDAAKALKGALDNLIGVEISAVDAGIAWRDSLRKLREEMGKTTGKILGHSKEADANKSLINDTTGALLERVSAEARAGKSIGKITANFKASRKAMIDQAVAAGANRKEMEAYLKIINFTPKAVRTLIEAVNVDAERGKMEKLIERYKLTPKQVKSIIEAAGADTAAAKVKALQDYINGLHDKTVNITTYAKTLYSHQESRLPSSHGANGGLSHQPDNSTFGLESYASGGIRGLAPGIYRGRRIMFAEPGTGGEAFIPLADHKRKRSEMLLGTVAQMFGGEFVKFANGGFNNLSEAVLSSSRGVDANSLAVSVSAPNVNVQAGGGGGALRLLEGKIGFDESGNAYIRGVVEEVVDDSLHYGAVTGRMN